MSAELLEGWRALRRSVTLCRLPPSHRATLPAEVGLAALQPALASNLELREAQFRPVLALDEAGRPTVDALMGTFRGELVILAESQERLDPERYGVSEEAMTWLSLDGPFAWEVLGAWDSPTAIGLPYLSAFLAHEDVLVIRAGRTGEFGYLLRVPDASLEAVWSDLATRVEAMEGAIVEPEVLARGSFENWVFDLHRDGRFELDALELQLTWRLDLGKAASGLDAIRAHREAGLRRRIVALHVEGPVAEGAPVTGWAGEVGRVLTTAPVLGGDGHHAVAVIDARYAHAGQRWTIGDVDATAQAAPFVLNRSLFVNPQRHAWATRDEIELPETVRWANATSW